MSAYPRSEGRLEAAMAEMGRDMTYPSTPDFGPAFLSRLESAAQEQQRLPTRRKWLVAVPAALLLAAFVAVAYGTFIGEGAKAPIGVAEDAAAPSIENAETTAELATEFETARQAETSGVKAGLMMVSIGNVRAESSSWAVDPGAGTWTRLSSAGAEQDTTAVDTTLELSGLALNEKSDAPLANVYVHGDYALVGGMSEGYSTSANVGIRILDISDPTQPQLAGHIPLRSREMFDEEDPHSHGDALATRIESEAFQGDIAIVGQGVPESYGVDDYPMPFGIWDISNPGDPEFLSVVSQGYYSWMHESGDLGDKPEDAKAVHGNTFFFVYNNEPVTNINDWFSYDFRLAVVDLSDPRNPLAIGEWDNPDNSWLYSVALNQSGTRAYIAGIDGPPPLGSDDDDGFVDSFGFSRIILYVLDIQDPGAPDQIARYVYPYPTPSVHRPRAVPNEDETLLVLADGRWGQAQNECVGWGRLHFLDISDLSSIHELSTFAIAESDTCRPGPSHGASMYSAWDVAVKGDLVYSVWLRGGLHVVDISDPENPVAAGEFRAPDGRGPSLSDVAMYGDYALASSVWWHGLYVMKLR